MVEYLCGGRVAGDKDRSRSFEVRARSLRSDCAVGVLGRYIATELDSSSVATSRPSSTRARSLRSDRAVCMLGLRVLIELGLSVVRLSCSSSSMASQIRVRCLGTICIWFDRDSNNRILPQGSS
ncbi:hypothetical protein F2Q70_00026125 [Brassica cretica]|uniref:Uncharacterized protein n=1 Tax=Brassica cretica TaxID=69181 RepID=A0A8S9LA40_BRACR|nr:hypothetical protein F2Q70_00026125 [Brassica cretica]